MGKKILMAATNYWTSPYQVGSHHYAREFARNGWEVLYVSDPISPFHNFISDKIQLSDRKKIHQGVIDPGVSRIQIYVPYALITPNEKPVFRSSIVSNNWHRLTVPNLIKHTKGLGFGEVDLLWFDSLSQYFWLDSIKSKKSILRIADRFDAFKKISPNLKKIENKLKERVDAIIYTAKSLKSYLKGYEDKMFYIPNGVNFEHFYPSDNRIIPEDLKKIPRPRAIYVGAIEEWFGVSFLMDVAKRCKGISFVMIGNPNIDISELKKLPNIFFLGRKDYLNIPSYISNCDVGIIVFDVNHPVVDTVNPIKLYEYMACGLPVVATKWKELELINSPAYLAGSTEEFANFLSQVQSIENEKYVEFAKENSWRKRFEDIIKIYN